MYSLVFLILLFEGCANTVPPALSLTHLMLGAALTGAVKILYL